MTALAINTSKWAVPTGSCHCETSIMMKLMSTSQSKLMNTCMPNVILSSSNAMYQNMQVIKNVHVKIVAMA